MTTCLDFATKSQDGSKDQHRGCTIYQGWPGVCRQYSCANDARIWKDFEALELNTESIEQNVGRDRNPVVTRLLMHDPSDLTPAVRTVMQDAP